MKQVIPEIYVRSCREALDFYKKLFGGTIKNLQMSDNMELFQDMPGKVVHAELHVNSRCVFYFVDVLDKRRAMPGNVTLMLHMDSKAEIDKTFKALSCEGTVLMDLQKTFWGDWHAIVSDRFGAPWALSFAEKKEQ